MAQMLMPGFEHKGTLLAPAAGNANRVMVTEGLSYLMVKYGGLSPKDRYFVFYEFDTWEEKFAFPIGNKDYATAESYFDAEKKEVYIRVVGKTLYLKINVAEKTSKIVPCKNTPMKCKKVSNRYEGSITDEDFVIDDTYLFRRNSNNFSEVHIYKKEE
jgi:hypothetical protein